MKLNSSMLDYIWFPFSPLHQATSHDAHQTGHWTHHGWRALLVRLWIDRLRLSSSSPHPGLRRRWPSRRRRHRRCAPSLPLPSFLTPLPLPSLLFFTPLLFPVHKMMSGRGGRGSPKGIVRFIDCHLRQVLIETARAYERDGDIGLHFLQGIENADF